MPDRGTEKRQMPHPDSLASAGESDELILPQVPKVLVPKSGRIEDS